MPLIVCNIYCIELKLRTTDRTIKRMVSAIVNLLSIPSLERPLFLLQYELVLPPPPAIADDRPSPFESCIRTTTTMATQTSINNTVRITFKAPTLLTPPFRIELSGTKSARTLSILSYKYPNDKDFFYFYLISSDSPVISTGFSIPIISSIVGTISHSLPPSLMSFTPSALTTMKGTGLVV